MIVLTGSCDKCGKLMQSKAFDPKWWKIGITGEINIMMICNDCYNRHYSPEAIREQKLNKVLKKKWWLF